MDCTNKCTHSTIVQACTSEGKSGVSAVLVCTSSRPRITMMRVALITLITGPSVAPCGEAPLCGVICKSVNILHYKLKAGYFIIKISRVGKK